MELSKRPIPLYTTSGDTGGYLVYPYIFDNIGEWIGWVAVGNDVYSVFGRYVGWLSKDRRILRRRADDFQKPNVQPLLAPSRILPPATVPLPPLMPELKYETVDVLEDMPNLMPRLDDFALSDDA